MLKEYWRILHTTKSFPRLFTTSSHGGSRIIHYPQSTEIPTNSLYLIEDAVSKEEEQILINYLHNRFKNKKYQKAHWDSVITRYRETECDDLPKDVDDIIRKIKEIIQDVMGENFTFLSPHAIDLAAKGGFIGPHIDSIKFSGKIVAGLSLVSSRLMELVHEENEAYLEPKALPPSHPKSIEMILYPRSLYILTGLLRYNYTHQIYGTTRRLENEEGVKEEPMHYRYKGISNPMLLEEEPQRRLSIILRDVKSDSKQVI